jgi:hypothetical protein
MSAHLSLAPLLESFFRRRLTKQRNASPSTVASYRDALRMLVLFVAEKTGRKPSALGVADFDRDLVLAFLDELEEKRKNTVQTRNARLTANLAAQTPPAGHIEQGGPRRRDTKLRATRTVKLIHSPGLSAVWDDLTAPAA